MSYIERKKDILEYVKKKGGACSKHSLSRDLFVSRSTLRRDLLQMEEEGIIQLHHGAISLVPDSATEHSIEKRRMENRDKKFKMARIAGEYIHDNMVLFLDSSSTVSHLGPILAPFQNITVITNGINIASQLHTCKGIRCYLCPGMLKHNSLSIVGEYTTEFISNFWADAVFFSCKALTTRGILEGDDIQALNKKSMLMHAEKRILLCDTTKEFASGFFKLAEFSDLDGIISDGPFSLPLMETIRAGGCPVITTRKRG